MNNTKFFADVYYLKRAQLLSEYLTGNLEKIDELYNKEFKNKVKDAETVDSLHEVVNSFTQMKWRQRKNEFADWNFRGIAYCGVFRSSH